jgi:amidase
MVPGTLSPAEPPPNLADHARTMAARDEIIRVWDTFLRSFDALLLPVAPCVAFPHGPPGSPLVVDGVAVESWRIDHLLYPFSFTGNPTAVIPAGVDKHGLPIGVQLVGRRWDDEHLLAVAGCVDEIVGGYRRPPGY